MIYRFFVALAFTFLVFPFAAMYTFAAVYPEAHFAFDRQTWLQGMAPIAFGWVLFLLPGLLPFVGHRYYSWVAHKTGIAALVAGIGRGLRRLRDALKWLRLKGQTALANRVAEDGAKISLRERLKSATDAYREWRSRKDVSSPPSDQRVPDGDEQKITQEALLRAKAALKEAPKHIAGIRTKIDTLRHRLTPDDLQRTIDLNQYTLETFSHLKHILEDVVPSVELSPEDRAFCAAVVDAIPEPPSPSAADTAPPAHSFVYPPERRDALKGHAANSKVSIRDVDFQLAAQGDLERGLLLVRGIVAHECRDRAVLADTQAEDLVVGLPVQSPA